MTTTAPVTLELNTKLAYLYEFSSETVKAQEFYIQCYNILMKQFINLRETFDIWEIKAYADCISLKIIKGQLAAGEFQRALDSFKIQYNSFKQNIKRIPPELEYMVRVYKKIIGIQMESYTTKQIYTTLTNHFTEYQ